LKQQDTILYLQSKILSLEDENDALAQENQRLREKVEVAERLHDSKSESAVPSDSNPAVVENNELLMDLLIPGNGIFPNKLLQSIPNCHGGTNVLSARFHCLLGFLVTAAVDKNINIFSGDGSGNFNANSPTIIRFSAPVLKVEFSPDGSKLLACCMDGSHSLIHKENSGTLFSIAQSFSDHSKYVVDCKWSADGSIFATASHDKSVGIYRIKSDGVAELVNKVFFVNSVEAIEFTASYTAGDLESELVVSLRDNVSLVYINCTSQHQRKVSINDADWDSHVSFTIMHMQISPDGKFLLASTDKSRIIVYGVGSNRQLRNFYGHVADEYSNPRAAWHPSGKYVFGNSQLNHEICVWCVASQNMIMKLSGHTKLVRDVFHHPEKNLLLSASYDGSIKIWSYADSSEETFPSSS